MPLWLSDGDNGYAPVDLRDSRIAELCRRYGVAELSVFGSVARGEDTDGSDVDLLYVLAPDSTLGFEIVDLRDDLEEIVGRHVDLVSKSRRIRCGAGLMMVRSPEGRGRWQPPPIPGRR